MDWSKPDDTITDLEIAFPVEAKTRWAPPEDEIPDEFKQGENDWVQFQRDWIAGLIVDLMAKPKEGIDAEVALRHLGCVQTSFELSAEHKEAAVAYLASLWFEDAQYVRLNPARLSSDED